MPQQRVLLLEEDATYAEGLVRGLSESGRGVTLLRDGDAGLERVQKESFDVLLVSAELPGINGFRLCGRLRKLPNFRAPIVLMGSDRTVGFDEHQKLPARAHGYLRKPVVIGELIAMLERITSGSVAPPPRPNASKLRPSQRPPAPNAAALAKALDRAEEHSTALAELRKQLAEQEAFVAELQKARAKQPPPLPQKKPAEEAAQRELHQKRERELLETRAALDAERHAGIDLRNAIAERDARLRTLEAELREQAARTKRFEELASAATSVQKDVGRKQGESDKQLELIRARAAQERAEAAKTAQAFSDELAALRIDLDKERERADFATKRATKASAAAEAEMERLRQELTAAKGATERQDKRVKDLTFLAGTAKADLDKERAARVAAEQSARALREEVDAARRTRVGNDADLAGKLAEATRAVEDAQRARAELESAQAKRLTQLRAHHEAERTKLLEEARAAKASEAELQAELERRRDEGEERLSRAEEQYVRHMSDVAAQQRMQATAIADAERLREEVKSTKAELEATHARVTELETALETMFEAQTARRQGAEVDDSARARMQTELESLEKKHATTETALRAMEQALESRRTELERAEAERDQALAQQAALTEQLAHAERGAKEKVERADASLRQLRAAHTAEINLLREAHGKAIGTRDKALASGLERVARETEERVTRALASEHSAQIAIAEQRARDEADVEHASQLAELRAEADRAIAEARASEGARVDVLNAQIAELSRALAAGRESLDAERRGRLKEQAEGVSQLEAMQRQIDELRAQLAAKEQEVASLRRSVEHETTAARAALEELEQERTLIAQAKTVLSELVARIDEPGDEAVPSRRGGARKR